MPKIGLIQLFVLSATALLGAADKEITLCDLADHKSFEGKHVVISGRIVFWMHGTAYLPGACKNGPPGLAVLLPNGEASPKIEAEVLQRLSPFFRINGGTTTACGTLSGQLLYKRHFHLRHPGAGPQGNGYGSRGALRWGLVVDSVGELRTCE
jgi:hypothetical protein